MVLELTSTKSAQWPLNTDSGESVEDIVTLNGIRKVHVEVSIPLYLRWRKVQHFWVFNSRSTGSDRDFYDVFLAHFPSPTTDDVDTFVQRLEAEIPGYDAAKQLAEAQAKARSAEELKGIKPWIRARHR